MTDTIKLEPRDLVKVQFGAGANRPHGWINHDAEIDIRRPLPYGDGEVDYVLAEHLLEHVDHHEGYRFIGECRRILRPRTGVLRICVPDIAKIFQLRHDEAYLNWLKAKRWGDGTPRSAITDILFNHGHQAAYTRGLATAMLGAWFVFVEVREPRQSPNPALHGVDGHHHAIGFWNDKTTTCLEAWG